MKYQIEVEISAVAGQQTFVVNADSPAAALERFKRHGGKLICHDLEVTDLDIDGLTLEDVRAFRSVACMEREKRKELAKRRKRCFWTRLG